LRSLQYDNSDVNVGYVPSGMSVHEWHEIQRTEKKQQKTKNFAAFGPTSFKSRSLQGFQEDLEKGKSKHLFPVMYAKERLKQGQIKAEDIPVSHAMNKERGLNELSWCFARLTDNDCITFRCSTCNVGDGGITVMSREQKIRRCGPRLTRKWKICPRG
jgi:hypothetical protein